MIPTDVQAMARPHAGDHRFGPRGGLRPASLHQSGSQHCTEFVANLRLAAIGLTMLKRLYHCKSSCGCRAKEVSALLHFIVRECSSNAGGCCILCLYFPDQQAPLVVNPCWTADQERLVVSSDFGSRKQRFTTLMAGLSRSLLDLNLQPVHCLYGRCHVREHCCGTAG